MTFTFVVMFGQPLDEAGGVILLEVVHSDGQALVDLEELEDKDHVVHLLGLLQPLVQQGPASVADEPAHRHGPTSSAQGPAYTHHNNDNDNNKCISRAPFHVKHAQLR